MKESPTVEFKEKVSKTFLKTVSAYANYGMGCILFGVDDKGEEVGVSDPADVRLSVENAINDALDPRPEYYLQTEERDGRSVVRLTVHEGPDKPYLYSGKAYRRVDTATVAVDRSELRRLAIEGSDRPYDEMDAVSQTLTFATLRRYLSERMNIEDVSDDALKTLGLLRDDRFNNAAALLADENGFPGVDIVRYANDSESIHERITCEGMSVLDQLDRAVAEYRRHYILERIRGMIREKYEVIPEDSFREAVANALVHRIWYIEARTIVSFYGDRIEIVSPGGLPADIDEALYVAGGLSVPRNSSLAYVFLRLGIIERLGTGVKRIRRAYGASRVKPSFSVSPHAIRVMLPALDMVEDLSEDELRMLGLFKPGLELSSADLEEALGVSRSTVVRMAALLQQKGALERVGNARATRYRLP